MNEISKITAILFVIAVLGIMIFVLITTLNKNYNEKTMYCNDLTPEEEIIMLLKNIARNQKIIKTNTTIIAVILLIPILISIFIWATGASIISILFN